MLSISGLAKKVFRSSNTFVIRRWLSETEKISIEGRTGFVFGKIKEPIGSIFYGASGHMNLKSNSSDFNVTATHSSLVKENGLQIIPSFISIYDLTGQRKEQRDIQRYIPLQTIQYSPAELLFFNYLWMQCWAFINKLRFENPLEFQRIKNLVQYESVFNNYTKTQRKECEEYYIDLALVKNYNFVGYTIPKESTTLLSIL